MDFIALFTQVQLKDYEQSTSQEIPDSSLILNHQVQQVLYRPTPLCIITAFIHSKQAQKFVRNTLFQLNQKNNENVDTFQQRMVMFKKIQTGYTNSNQAINWIYFQVNQRQNPQYVNMLKSITCTLIYQQQSVENDRIFLQKTSQFYKQITGRNPIIFYIRKQNQNEQNILKQLFNLHQISLPSDIQNLGNSKIKSIYQIGRKIIGECFLLQNKKNVPISAAVIPLFIKKWNQQSSFQKIQASQKIWNSALQQLQRELKEKCLSQYKGRMLKLYDDKKLISMKLLKNSHQISMQIALKSVQKYKTSSQNIQQRMQEEIKSQLNKMLQQVMQINYNWGKNFIQSQYSQIQTRLKTKQFKSISSIKNQLNIFRDYFHKKTQPLSCKKLQNYFEEFLTEKAFQSCNYIFDLQKKNLNTQISQLKTKLSCIQNEAKQLKRHLTKQLSQSMKNKENLQHKINNMKNRQQLLEKTIQQLKQERILDQQQNQQKLQQIQKQLGSQISILRQQNASLMEQISQQKRKISSLESQIEKQKQMHRQTNQHYKQIVTQLKNKQAQLLDQITEISMRASQQLEEYRKDAQISLSKSSMSRNQKQKEGLRMLEEFNQINSKYGQLQKAYNNLEYEVQLKKAQESVFKNDLQIALKIAEQKICEYQIKMPRYLKMQQQLSIYQQTMKQHSNKQKQIQKQTALLRQQNSFIIDHIKEIQQKYQSQKLENRDLKVNIEELEQKLGKMNKTMVNQWAQTENDDKFKEMLEDALKVVNILEDQYNKVKIQNQKLRYRSSNY